MWQTQKIYKININGQLFIKTSISRRNRFMTYTIYTMLDLIINNSDNFLKILKLSKILTNSIDYKKNKH